MMARNDADVVSKQFKQMNINSDDVNILLMGETGVGKSTFINAFANYMEYNEFHVAEKSQVRCLIPASFSVTDENMEEKLVKIGRDKNENEELGESATQGARSYVFPLMKYKKRIRLIDTPGVGDTRGLAQDNVNFENILDYVSNMEYLHAICFLLKPNNSRLTVLFEYCIKQLLSRLEKSASKNIIFLFTNSRSTFYRPGDTAPALKKILAQVKDRPPHVNIQFERENVFCLDNESFRFMVSCKNGIRFTQDDKQSFAGSWDQSVKECWRMIDYITGQDTATVKLTPHRVQDTVSVNHARRIIIQLSQPLADIAELINDNINLLERHNSTLKMENLSMNDLKKRLYVPVVNLRHIELSQPTTVCTHKHCCEIYTVGDKKKYHYKQRCHDPCYLQNVPQEIIGSPELVNCFAINKSTKKCNKCSCDFSAHMHVYYLTETYEDKITDTGVASQITDRETAVKEAQKLIAKIEARKCDYDNEKETIAKCMAKFAHFLQHNAIAPYNDAYKAYLEYLIDRENSYGQDADTQLILYYRDLLRQYDEEKNVLDSALQMSADGTSTSVIKAGDIFHAVQTLFKLKYTGHKIRELHEKQRKSRHAEYESNTEYVLDELKHRNVNPSIKEVTGKKNKKKNKPNKNNEDDLPPDVASLDDLFKRFPGMEEYFEQKYLDGRNKMSDSNDYDKPNEKKLYENYLKNRGNKTGKASYTKQGCQQQVDQKNKQGQGPNNRGQRLTPGQYIHGPGSYNKNHGNYKQRSYNQYQITQNHSQDSYNQQQGRGGFNQGRGGFNQAQCGYNHKQGCCNQEQGGYIQGYNQGQHYQYTQETKFLGQGSYNQRQRPPLNYSQEQYPYKQGAPNQQQAPYNQGPFSYNQGVPNQGEAPYNRGPLNQSNASVTEGYVQNPGSSNYGQGPDLCQSVKCVQMPYNPYNQGQTAYNQRQPPYNQGQNQNSSQGSGSTNQIPNQYNQRQDPYSGGPYRQDSNAYDQSYEGETKFTRDSSNHYVKQNNAEGEPKQKNFDFPLNNRPMGPYRPDGDKTELRHFNKLWDDSNEVSDDPEEEERHYKEFTEKHGLQYLQKDTKYKANNKNKRGNFSVVLQLVGS